MQAITQLSKLEEVGRKASIDFLVFKDGTAYVIGHLSRQQKQTIKAIGYHFRPDNAGNLQLYKGARK